MAIFRGDIKNVKQAEKLFSYRTKKALEEKLANATDEISKELAFQYKEYVEKRFREYITDMSSFYYKYDEVGVILRHTTAKRKQSSNWYENPMVLNPIGQSSVNMQVVIKRTNAGEHAYRATVMGTDIKFLEYGTGVIGLQYKHPQANANGWTYNVPPKYKDKQTGLDYWIYSGIAKIGAPAGAFIYKARQDLRDYIRKERYDFIVSPDGSRQYSIPTIISEAFKG